MFHQVTQKMTEQTSQKEISGRTVVVVLGIICIVLSAGFIAVFALYLPAADSASKLQAEIKAKDGALASQNATIVSLTQQIAALQLSLQQSLTTKDQTIAELNSYISDLWNVLYLNATTILLQNQNVQIAANESMTIWSEHVSYAGLIEVQVQSSSNTTYVEAIYASRGVNYNEIITVGASGTAAFPVLPTIIDIRVGNTEPSVSVDAVATALYHY